MIHDLQPHAAYKDSGAAWVGRVPSHWQVLPNRALFGEVKDRDHPNEEMLSVTITRGIVKQKALLSDSSKKDSSNLDKSAYKLVQPRDIAYNKMRAWQGAIGASELRGIISPAYVVMRLRHETDLPGYYHHLYRTPAFAKEAERWSYGITSDMWSLRPEHFKMIYTPQPPPEEQAVIVRFLEHANGRLERAIRAKRKVIALLNEQKQAIIHRAVTRGLNPEAPLKPSGIPWLGDIPHHWEIYPARALFSEIRDRGFSNETMLSVTIKRGVITQAELLKNSIKKDSSNEDKSKYKLLAPGDIAYNKMRAWQGAFGVSALRGIISPAYIVIRPTESADGNYFHHVFRTPAFAKEAERWSYGIASDMWSLRPEDFRLIKLPRPPALEQAAIANFLNTELVSFDTAIHRLEREIALLREYRTRLVADVVTGQLDVRPAAPHLPAEVPLIPVDNEDSLASETSAETDESE
jgi:type I restriction enzyme S subunit